MGDTDAQRQLWRRLALLGSRRQHRGVSGDCRRRSRPAVFLQPAARARRLRPSAVPIGSRSATLRWPATAGQEERERHRCVRLQRGVAPYRGPYSTGAGPRVRVGPIQRASGSVSGTGACVSRVEWRARGACAARERERHRSVRFQRGVAPYRGPDSTGAGPRVRFGPIQRARESLTRIQAPVAVWAWIGQGARGAEGGRGARGGEGARLGPASVCRRRRPHDPSPGTSVTARCLRAPRRDGPLGRGRWS
jgi:hypothetical protein